MDGVSYMTKELDEKQQASSNNELKMVGKDDDYDIPK